MRKSELILGSIVNETQFPKFRLLRNNANNIVGGALMDELMHRQ